MEGVKEATTSDWAFSEFGHAEIADWRWGRRLVDMAAQAARRPAGAVTATFTDAAERQGAYGLLESRAVEAAPVAEAMFVACARRCAEEDFVFCPVDGTSLTLTDGKRTKDFGSVGSRAQGARGLKVINAIALSADGVPLGVTSQQWWARPAQRRRKHRDQLPARAKETAHWLDAIEQTRQVMAEHAPNTRCWFQLDREGDAWPILTSVGAQGHWFTVRASHNRRTRLPDGRRGEQLHTVLAGEAVKTSYTLEVRGGPNRRARTAVMDVRACVVTLDFRDKRTQRRFSMTVNVVQAAERAATVPDGEKPIVWTLLTNRPITTLKDLRDVVFGYSMRWRIEEVHRTWKSGACGVEDTQLRSATTVIKWATILVAVAIRIERIKQLARETPDQPAADEFTPIEIRAAALLRFGKEGPKRLANSAGPTIAEVTLWIAQIGGYTGRTSSGGPPGSTTLARGLQQLQAAVQALEALEPSD